MGGCGGGGELSDPIVADCSRDAIYIWSHPSVVVVVVVCVVFIHLEWSQRIEEGEGEHSLWSLLLWSKAVENPSKKSCCCCCWGVFAHQNGGLGPPYAVDMVVVIIIFFLSLRFHLLFLSFFLCVCVCRNSFTSCSDVYIHKQEREKEPETGRRRRRRRQRRRRRPHPHSTAQHTPNERSDTIGGPCVAPVV